MVFPCLCVELGSVTVWVLTDKQDIILWLAAWLWPAQVYLTLFPCIYKSEGSGDALFQHPLRLDSELLLPKSVFTQCFH